MGDDGTSGNAADDDEEASSGLFLRTVWFRQMLHRWQSSSSTSGTTTKTSSATGVERANDDLDASTDRTNNDAAAAGSRSERDPLPRQLPRVVEERFPADEVAGGSVDSPPMAPDAPAGVPRGCCPVYVGLSEPRRRFVVPTSYLGVPVFRRLLEKAEEESEFHYGDGGVTIPCDTEVFKYILLVLEERHRLHGLVDDDEGNAARDDGGGEHGGSSSQGDEKAQPMTSSAADGGVIGGAKAIIVHGT